MKATTWTLPKVKTRMATFFKYFEIFFKTHGVEILPLYEPIHLKKENQYFSDKLPVSEKVFPEVAHIPRELAIVKKDFEYILKVFVKLIACQTLTP